MPIFLDGGLATTLQARGMPRGQPVDAWVERHPEQVAGVHVDFAAAGAEILFAGTFRMLPGVQPRWRELAPLAVQLAKVPGTETWASLGPIGRRGAGASWAAVASALDVDGVVLETFTDPAELDDAIAAVRSACDLPIAALVVPASDGRARDGQALAPWLDRWLAMGVYPGFNCASTSAIHAALDGWAGPAWVKPSDATATDVASFARRARAIGGCCGVGPETLRAAIADVRAGAEYTAAP